MRRFFGLTVVLTLMTTPAPAAELAPGLTPTRAAEGGIALFDGESTFGWKVDGSARVQNGQLIVGGTQATTLTTTSVFPQATVQLDCTPPRKLVHKPGSAITLTVPAGQTVTIRSLTLQPQGMTALLNGKDLTGWTIFQDDPTKNKAQFTITPQGELHVLGGPGDIRTARTFADFVLQTQVRTAGPHVNSGIFFRCVPGQYQNGYECQIQNLFRENDRTKPVDFGTGAVYRRVPARKVVPNDKEWFTLTLIASGPHISSWVNGYPVVDWTDERPANENPRKGLRTAAGHLSIQGHNPPMSADLLFRALRIVELQPKP
ncbi:MAG: DUF1080 domain-containing protein [Bacteroidales bacterium]|nr:DUF1080 domain-containing protein [Bacteroidales bacterium]